MEFTALEDSIDVSAAEAKAQSDDLVRFIAEKLRMLVSALNRHVPDGVEPLPLLDDAPNA